MNLLAIDSGGAILAAALSRGEKLFDIETDIGTKHSAIIIDCIDSLFKKADIKPRELNGVLCAGGPGSFTGLRAGFAAAKGLSLSLSIPFISIFTFDCLAFPYQDSASMILAVIESSKKAWFFSFYQNNKIIKPALEGESALIAAEIDKTRAKNIILTGPGAASLYETMPEEIKKKLSLDRGKNGRAKELISIAKKDRLFDNINTISVFSCPEYIKRASVESI